MSCPASWTGEGHGSCAFLTIGKKQLPIVMPCKVTGSCDAKLRPLAVSAEDVQRVPQLHTGSSAAARGVQQWRVRLLTSIAACLCGEDTAMITLASHTFTVPVRWAIAMCVTCHFSCNARHNSCNQYMAPPTCQSLRSLLIDVMLILSKIQSWCMCEAGQTKVAGSANPTHLTLSFATAIGI
jgi:hypothetical protein